jgi:hypothetical protein
MGSQCDYCQNVLAENLNGILRGALLIYNSKRPNLILNYIAYDFIHKEKSREASFSGFI